MHEPLCEVLLEKLCTAVQKVQELYASGQEIIKDCEPVDQLCQVVDDILSHGLREGILNWASGSETTYWPLVNKVTYKEVLQSISRIPSLKNDKERCQVWVRIACQENSLGSYLNIITQDDQLLTDFYQPHAFVFDKEKVDTAKTALLYGLSHLDFNITLDIPRHDPPARTESFTGPEKSHSFNGLESSFSTSSKFTNSVASSSFSTVPQGKNISKKKKKVKSSVAKIADSLDDGVGVMNSVEKYLYNMSDSHENNKTEGEALDVQTSGQRNDHLNMARQVKVPKEREIVDSFQNDSHSTRESKDNEEISSLMQTDQLLTHSKDDLNKTEEGLQNIQDLQYREEKSSRTEVSMLENIKLGVNEVSLAEENQYHNDVHQEHDQGNDRGPQEENGMENSPFKNHTNQSNKETQSPQNYDKPFQQHEEKKIDNEFDYQVSRAHFKYGTPTEQSLDISKDENVSPEDNNDFNFVPGIHKADTWRSHSGSFNSLNGSGSFNDKSRPGTEKLRSSTLDSKTSMSSSIPPDESWRYVTNTLAGIERKDSRVDNMSIATEDSLGDLAMFEELLGVSEDHFSSPESFMGLTSSEEFQHAIVSCKEMIKATNNPEEKKKLVKQLIQLRIKQQEHKDDSFTEKIPDARKILGHQFIKEQDTKALSNVICDRCGKWVWTMWQSLFTCQDCQFHSHRKCLDMIRRHCASRKVSVSSYSMNIAPESGLHAQQYKCVECRKMISLAKSGQGEARLCDYSGQYFCEDCHWNDQVVIPARIVHNWDFGTYKVSRQTKQFLDLMAKKPILDLDQLNPALFKFVGELRDIKRFREEILVMKKYFMSCRSALESKLLLHLQDRQHFVDNSSSYSLQDLLEVERGTMLPFITRVHSLFLTHIKSDCELCRAKGFVCEICRADEIIFAFDPHAIQCTDCRTVFHRLCFKKDSCPKCQRIKQRTPK